jgi:electron transport complex protein RnfG
VKNKKPVIKSALLRDALALFLITLVSGLALSYVYEITKEPIAVQAEQKTLEANKAVFPNAAAFELDQDLMDLAADTDLKAMNADYSGVTINEISKAYDSSNQVIGYNITVSTSAGYKDGIKLVYGYSLDGSILGVEFLSISETAGLGMKAVEPAFKDQFLNKKVKQYVVTKTGARSEEEIDAISAATITSRAVTNAINAGIGFVTENAVELGGGQ